MRKANWILTVVVLAIVTASFTTSTKAGECTACKGTGKLVIDCPKCDLSPAESSTYRSKVIAQQLAGQRKNFESLKKALVRQEVRGSASGIKMVKKELVGATKKLKRLEALSAAEGASTPKVSTLQQLKDRVKCAELVLAAAKKDLAKEIRKPSSDF